ncbi:MAG: hypothetical protein ACTSRS_07590 [Candidatus Helarchaeota archaeon]
MVTADTRAILETDLAKIGAIALTFFLAYLLTPIAYLGLMRITPFLEEINLSTFSFSTIMLIALVILLFFFWTVALFFLVIRGLHALQRKYGTPIKRSATQEKVRIVLIILGFFIAVGVIYFGYLKPIMSVIEFFPVRDLPSLLVEFFSFISLTEAAVLTTFLGIIYGLVFISDGLFHLIRRSRHTPLPYPERPSALRRWNFLKSVSVVLITILSVNALILYMAHPTTLRLRSEPVAVTYLGASEPHSVVLEQLLVFTDYRSGSVWERFDYLANWNTEDIYPTIYVLYIMDNVTSLLSKAYQITIPQGRHVVGFILKIKVDGTPLMAKYYPTADKQNTACGFLTKWFCVKTLTIFFSGMPTNFTFQITLTDEFWLEDWF